MRRRVGGSPGVVPAGVGSRGVRCRAAGWGTAAGLGAGRGGVPVLVPRHAAGGRCRVRWGGRGRPGAVVGTGQRVHHDCPGARSVSGAHRCSPAARRADQDRCRSTVPTDSGSEVAALLRPDRGRGGRVPGVAPRPVRVASPVLDAGRGRSVDCALRVRATGSGRRAGPGGRFDRAQSRCGGSSVPSQGHRRECRAAATAGPGRPPGVPRPAGDAAPRGCGRGGRPGHPRSGRCRFRRGGSARAGAPWPGRQRRLVRAGRAAGCARCRCRRGSAGRGTEDATRSSARPSRTAWRGGATGRRSRRDSSACPVAGPDEGVALAPACGWGGTWTGCPSAYGRIPMTGSRPLAHGDCHLVAPCRAGHPPVGGSSRPARRSCGRRVAA